MAKTILGLYDTFSEARQVVEELVSAGISRDRISLVASDKEGRYQSELKRDTTDTVEETKAPEDAAKGAVTGGILGGIAGVIVGLGVFAIPGIGPAIAAGPIISGLVGAGVGAVGGGLLGSLVGMGVPKEEAGYYAEGVRRDGTLIVVEAQEHEVDRITDVMNRHNPVDIEKRAATWREQGWRGYEEDVETRSATAEPYYETGHPGYESPKTTERRDKETTERIPVVEEELRVGKREVSRGGVRIHTFVEEKPVEKNVNLREEHVSVERRRVDRPVSEADLKDFKEGTVEFRETKEEPVVDKSARVVEEVVVKKDVEERPETVRGTERHTRVDVDKLGLEQSRDVEGYEKYRSDFQKHFSTNYASSGGTYSDYEDAYRFGSTLSSYRGRRWEEIEPKVRQQWESKHKGTWEKFKDSIRYAWNRL